MPESRRRKPKSTPSRGPVGQPVKLNRAATNPVWLVPTMVAMFALSIIWLLVYYFSNGGVLFQKPLGGWNILIGFGFAVVGLGLATRWR